MTAILSISGVNYLLPFFLVGYGLRRYPEQLLHHAEKILLEMQSAREALGHLGKWGKGRLRLGASTTACQYIIPPVLREFKESFPDHAITIEPGAPVRW